MILDLPTRCSFLTYDVFKSHINVTESLEFFVEVRIEVGKEAAGTRIFYQAYDKLQANQDKAQTRQIMELAWRKVHGMIKQWQLNMIISTSIRNIPAKI